MNLVSLDQAKPVLWRNGGGVTRELWAWPCVQHWQVRISVADIAQHGPFSAFPGVDRWFAVLDGVGVELAFAHGGCTLGPDDAPLPFDGAAAPGCHLRAGPTRDLNLMTLRSAGRGSMQRVQAGVPWQCPAPLRAVFAATPLLLQVDAAEPLELPAWTLAVHTSAAGQAWAVRGPVVRAWWLGFEPEGALPP
jgi:uncharacterized protein